MWWPFHTVVVGYLKSRPPQLKPVALLFSPRCKCSPFYIWIASMHFAERRTVCHKAPSTCFLTLEILTITKRKMTKTMPLCLISKLEKLGAPGSFYSAAAIMWRQNVPGQITTCQPCLCCLDVLKFTFWFILIKGGLSSLQFSSQ